MDALIDDKLEKHKNLQEQSSFYWSEIELGTLKFDRVEMEVCSSLVITILGASIRLDESPCVHRYQKSRQDQFVEALFSMLHFLSNNLLLDIFLCIFHLETGC